VVTGTQLARSNRCFNATVSKGGARQKTKSGRAFERAVRDVMRAMDPGATARQGEWVVGPDGRREVDVLVEGAADGDSRSVLIECKDFDPKKTGRVGIQYVDALDSKRRDLGNEVALICSNAGFTRDAKRKAKRVGIGLMGVMRKGDDRIRVFIEEDMYVRETKLHRLVIALSRDGSPIDLTGVRFEEVLFEGQPVGNWVIRRLMLLVGTNPIVKGSFKVTHPLKEAADARSAIGASPGRRDQL
jgi:hypothetical protein